MRYIGIDMHSRQSRICVLDEHGVLEREWTVRGPWPEVVEALAEVESPFAVCYEAGLGYGYLHDASDSPRSHAASTFKRKSNEYAMGPPCQKTTS